MTNPLENSRAFRDAVDVEHLVSILPTLRSDERAQIIPLLLPSLTTRPASERFLCVSILADLMDPLGPAHYGDRDLVNLVVPVVSAHVTDPDATVRSAAVEGLGRLYATSAAQVLRGATRDPEASVRQAAAWALGRVTDRSDNEPLLEMLFDDEPAVRTQAAQALGHRVNRQAFDLLRRAVEDPFPAVRRYAVVAVGWLQRALSMTSPPERPWQELEPFLALLNDPDMLVRVHAAAAIGGLWDKRLIEPLRGSLKDPSSLVRCAVARELLMLGVPAATIDPPPATRPDETVIPVQLDWTTLPQWLGTIVECALVELHDQTYHDLDADLRLTIYSAFGPRLDRRARRARGLLGLWVAERVRPLSALAYDHADTAIDMTRDVIDGLLVPSAAGTFVYDIWGGDWTSGCIQSPWAPDRSGPTHAATAAHWAACEAAGTNYLELLGSDHDAAANAAIAEAGAWYEDTDGDGPDYYDSQRLYRYWRWWLTAAVPAAWVLSTETTSAS